MKKNNNFTINRFFWPVLVVVVLVAVAMLSNAGGGNIDPIGSRLRNNNSPPVPSPLTVAPERVDTTSPGAALMIQEQIAHVVSMVRPAVVSISKQETVPVAPGNGLTHLNPFPKDSGPVGSGIIIDQRGYVLTTFLTVGKMNSVWVNLFSGGKRRYQADVIAVDAETDLALLKILGNEIFPQAILGNSDLLEVGDIVLAIGNPFGFSRTVTLGIVSSNRRSLSIDGVRYPEMIQTDATINEGNDGGPLINIRGEVVGVNMACYRPNDQYSGIGFAIPINDVLMFVRKHTG